MPKYQSLSLKQRRKLRVKPRGDTTGPYLSSPDRSCSPTESRAIGLAPSKRKGPRSASGLRDANGGSSGASFEPPAYDPGGCCASLRRTRQTRCCASLLTRNFQSLRQANNGLWRDNPLHHASHGPPPPRCGGGYRRRLELSSPHATKRNGGGGPRVARWRGRFRRLARRFRPQWVGAAGGQLRRRMGGPLKRAVRGG